METFPESLVWRVNGSEFMTRKEEMIYLDYETRDSFKELKRAIWKSLDLKYHSAARLFDKEGVELFEADIEYLPSNSVVYISSKGDDFNYSSVLGDYDIQKVLGEGGFGKVYLGVNRESSQKVAIKFMDVSQQLSHASQIEEIYREADALQKLNHNNIIRLYRAFVQK